MKEEKGQMAILNLPFHYIYQGISVPVVEIDERGCMAIPGEFGLRKSRALIIPAGSFFITVPLPKIPQKKTEKWLSTHKARRDLKAQAEKLATADAVKRAKRRNQFR